MARLLFTRESGDCDQAREEKRGITNGVGLDDNAYANGLIKRSLGLKSSEVVGFECRHVWPNTVIANLVLIPAALASLTDYEAEVQAALQYRAFELYRWHPNEKFTPVKPARYPENWREPQPDPRNAPDRLHRPPGRGLHPSQSAPIEPMDQSGSKSFICGRESPAKTITGLSR